jgi:hypothetical protein
MDSAARILTYLEDPGPPGSERTALSRRFENDDPTRISVNRNGRFFYGAFRLPGDEMSDFLTYLDAQDAVLAAPLLEAGGGPAAQKGLQEFREQWLSASRDPAFQSMQSAWIDSAHYEPFVQTLLKLYASDGDLAIGKRSNALHAVLWSVVNQHGRNNHVVANAWKGLHPASETDLVLICRIYAEERRKYEQYFPNESPTTYTLLKARYRFEQEEALRMVKTEFNMKDEPRCDT